MAIYLKQSTASQEVCLGYFVDSTDGNTEETGLTIANTDIKLHKAGATTLANKNSGGATHISNGIYYAVLDATDTDTLGPLVIYCHPTGALAVRVECCVLASNIYDSLIGGGDVLQVDVTQFGGTNATASGGRPEVNTTHAAGTAWGSGAITAASIATGAIDADAIATDAVTEIQSGLALEATLTSMKGATFDSATDSLEALRNRGDSAWATATGFATSAALTTVEGKIDIIDGIVDSILDDTGTSGVVVAAGSKTGYALTTGGIGTGDIDSTALNEIADAILDRVMSAGADSGGNNTTARTVRQALRTLRNKVTNAAGTLTVYKEDDTTTSFTAATATTAGDPISSIDPT